MNELYAAYGSNMSLQDMSLRCPDARFCGTAELPNMKLCFRSDCGTGWLNVEHRENHSVPVVVWQVSPADIQHLDWYERYPDLYTKKEASVEVKDPRSGEVRREMVFYYVMSKDYPAAMPEKSYLDTCLRAYSDYHFDVEPLIQALAQTEALCRLQHGSFLK